MRRLVLAPILGLVLALFPACHEELTTYQVCDAFKPHATGTDTLWAWTWSLGVYSCRARHDPDPTLFHNYCLYDDGNHWFVKFPCSGPQSADAGGELLGADGPPEGERFYWDGHGAPVPEDQYPG